MAQVPFFPFFRAIYFVLVVGIWKISGRCLVDGASGSKCWAVKYDSTVSRVKVHGSKLRLAPSTQVFFEILHAEDPKNIFTEHLKIGVDGASVT